MKMLSDPSVYMCQLCAVSLTEKQWHAIFCTSKKWSGSFV